MTNTSEPKILNAEVASLANSTDQLETKLDAMGVCEQELRAFPHPGNTETIRRNAAVCGAKSGFEAAEPLELLREVRQ